MDIHQNDLLFGATSSVMRYNCFPRLLDGLFNRIFGIPLIGYFEDAGALFPGNVFRRALRTFERFCRALGIKLKTTKTDRRQKIISLGVRCDFPSPANNMILIITLTEDEATTWTTMIHRVLSTASISRAALESVVGRLSIAQTSRFGRIGQCTMAPLYAKLRAEPYHSIQA